MSAHYETRFFTITSATGVGGTIDLTGFSFQPKCYRVWWNGRADLTTAVGRADFSGGVGCATSPTNRGCVAVFEQDAQASETGGSRIDDTAVIQTCDAAGAITGSADHNSFLPTGIRLIVDSQFAADFQIRVEAWGGDGITDVTVHSFLYGTSTGEQDITGVGFDPEEDSLLFFFGSPNFATSPPNDNEEIIQLMIGAVHSSDPTAQYVTVGNADDDSTTMDTRRYAFGGECIASIDPTGGATCDSRASFVGVVSDGFKIDVLEFSGAVQRHCFALIIKGLQCVLGDIVTPNGSTADIPITSLGFSPVGLSLFGTDAIENAQDVAGANWSLSAGSADATIDQGCLSMFAQNLTADSDVSTAVHYENIMAGIGTTSAFSRRLEIRSFNDDGFTAGMETLSSPMFVWYIAYSGEAAEPEPEPEEEATGDEKLPIRTKRRAKLTVYKKPAEPKKRTRTKKAQEIVIPIHEIPETIKSKLPVKKVTSGEFTATLEGCSMRATGGLGVSGEMQSTLQGVEMNAYAKLYMKDDAVAIYTGIPELVEEIEV